MAIGKQKNYEYKNRGNNFSRRTYIALKKDIAISEIANKAMYEEAGKKLYGYIGFNKLKPVGAWSVLYFKWDEPKGRTNMAIAVPIEKVKNLSNSELSLVDVPKSKASHAVLKGDYNGLKALHESLMAYVMERGIKTTLTVEEYTIGPKQEQDPTKWETNVYYLHK